MAKTDKAKDVAQERQFLISRRSLLKTGAAATAVAGAVVVSKPRPAMADPGDPDATVKWGMLIDLRKCVGCETCSVACKTQNDVPLGVFRSSVKALEPAGETFPNVTRDQLPWLCNHCDDAPCIADCPVEEIPASLTMPNGDEIGYCKKATYKRPDGLVLVDQDRCIGCGLCIPLCPYNVRFRHPTKETSNGSSKVTDKCDFCVNRISNGAKPACVQTCPHNARMIGNLLDPASNISAAIAAADHDIQRIYAYASDPGSGPNVYYVVPSGTDVDTRFEDGTDTKTRATS